jgi:hypothetical protein
MIHELNMDSEFEKHWDQDENFAVEIEQNDPSVLMENPFNPTLINIETKTPSLDTLIKRIRRNEIQMDTSTYFQRSDDLWDPTKQSRLIESILIRFPLPAFFFDATNNNQWLVVDGLQRLSSIRNFVVRKSLRLSNLEFLTALNGKGWDDLSYDLQRVIEESMVVVFKIMPGTPTDVKFNIFKRINTGGLVLEPQEIRHALFQGQPATYICQLARTPEFLKATNHKIPTHRMLDRDFANRFLAFYLLGYENYQPDLDTFMSKAMAMLNNKTQSELDEITQAFANAMQLALDIFGEEAFRKVTQNNLQLPPINKALFDAISTQFALLSEEQRIKLRKKGVEFKRLLQDILFEHVGLVTAITSSTGDKNRVLLRHRIVAMLIETVINSK